MLFVGSYLGDAYLAARGEKARAFEEFLLALAAAAGVTRPVTVLSPLAAGKDFVHVRVGAAPAVDGSNGVRPVAFVFAPAPATEVELRFEPGFFAGPVRDLLTGERVATQPDTGGLRVTLGPTEWGVSVLVG
jgi:catechol 2,3-dioxygenase-like lactoylglutathione lyase family enzyme